MRARGKTSGAKSLKLLIYAWLWALFASFALGHPCLAQALPQSYTFSVEDMGPFRGQFITKAPEWRLFVSNDVWDLEIKDEKTKRVSELALEDFRSSRYRTGALNPMLMTDWLLSFDPNRVIDSKGAKPIQPKKVVPEHFLNAWNSYLLRLQDEWRAAKADLQRRGYTTTAELYFSKALIQDGIVNALQDPVVLAKLRGLAAEILGEHLSALDLKLDENFETIFQNKTYRTQILGSLTVRPDLRMEDFEISFDPQKMESQSSHEVSMGKISFVLPLTEASVDVSHFEVRSDFTQKPYIISEADAMSMKIEFNRSKPFKLTANIFWNKILQQPEIRFPDKELDAPFKTAKLSEIHLRGERYEPSQGSVIEWMMNNEGWRLLQTTVESGGFVQNLIAVSTEQLSALLQKHLPFRETFVVIQNSDSASNEKFKLDVFRAGFAAHDPGLNPNLVARFQLTIPIEIKTPEMNLNVRPTEEALSGKIGIQILNPDVELEHLELFWKGKRLSSDRVGFRFRMINRVGGYTRLDADADLSVDKSLQFRLDKLQTNIEGLAIQALEVRMGDKWLAGNRPSLQMIVDNIALIRKELVSSTGQKGLGGKLQAFIENEIRGVMSERLKDLSVRIPMSGDRLDVEQDVSWYTENLGGLGFREKAKIGLKGELKISDLPIQEASFRLRDYKAQGPVCKGTYLISADTQIGITDAIPVIGKGWDIAIELAGYKSNISVDTFTASLVPEDETRLSFGFDICLSASRETVDIQLRNVRPVLSKMKVNGLSVGGLSVSNQTIEKVAKLFGWAKGISRDVAVASLLQNILIDQRTEIDSLVGQLQAPFFAEHISAFLNSAPIRGQIERSLIQVGDVEEQTLELMMDLGKSLKGPLEGMIIDNLSKIVNEHLPKVEAMLTTSRKTMDDLILNLGVLAGEDLEAVFRTQVLKFIYGETSSVYLNSEIRRLLTPSGAVKVLRNRFGLSVDPWDDIRWFSKAVLLGAGISDCPFQDLSESISKWKKALYDARLQPADEARIDEFVTKTCAGEAKPGFVSRHLMSEGILSANALLMNESIRSYLRLPSTDELPLATGPGLWSRDGRANQQTAYEIPIEISKVEMISTGTGDLFRVSLSSSAFSNEMGLAAAANVSSFVLQSLNVSDQNMVFRLPRPIINQVFLKVDWAQLVRQSFPSVFGPYDQIIVERAPFLTEDDEIIFKIYVRSRSGKIRLLVTPVVKLLASMFDENATDQKLNKLVESKKQDDDLSKVSLSDVAFFALSFLDLRNMFGFEASIEGAIRPRLGYQNGRVGIEFEAMDVQDVDAGFLKTPIQSRLEGAHKPLNGILAELLSQIGQIPSLDAMASRFVLSEMTLVKGDFFAVIRREDE